MSNENAWDLLVGRADLERTELIDRSLPEVGEGEVLLRVDRVGMTSNNVTYGLLGDAMNYWSFFPAEEGWGRVPLWGFADVAESNASGVEVGTRVYGYLPTSSHLVVRPGRVDGSGFRDASEHRAGLPGPYQVYAATTGDPSYEAEREDLQILYRPLFFTSFLLADFLDDHDVFGADTVIFSSASSKTAYGTAFCMRLHNRPVRSVGLTSAGNVGFTQELGCYDEVLSYEDVKALAADRASVYVDVAGSPTLREAIHSHLADKLVHDAIVGVTHHDETALQGDDELPGAKPEFFFAPNQIRKRSKDWGPGGIENNFGAAWKEFAPTVEGWVDVKVLEGPEGLREAWLEMFSGRTDPRTGLVIGL